MSDRQHAGDIGTDEPEIGAWIAFWVQVAVLALLAILGAFFASAAFDPGNYACGLILTIAAILLLLLCIKGYFDGNPLYFGGFLLVDDMPNLVLAIVVFVALGLGGVFTAASVGGGGLYVAGVALFAVSALAILLSMRCVFDNLDRRH
ncbi:MAG TPA: hypothetical protein VMF86_05910 [Stellaceae bacterium]|nr:hypothetical protein [Stellaceae bacterium]